MVLIVKQRNELAEILKSLGLSPSELNVNNKEKSYLVAHKSISFLFEVFNNDNSRSIVSNPYIVKTSPKGIVVEDRFFSGQSWEEVTAYFQQWAILLKEELEEPDAWDDMIGGMTFPEFEHGTVDEKYSQKEIKALEGRVKLVEQEISIMEIPVEAKAAFSEIARELPQDAKILTKKKLGELLVGQVMSQGFKWALTSEHMQTVWHAFKAFTQLFLN